MSFRVLDGRVSLFPLSTEAYHPATVWLSVNDFGDIGSFCSIIKNIEVLDFQRSFLSPEKITSLANGSNRYVLSELDLSRNELCIESITSLVSYINSRDGIMQKLRLQHTRLSDHSIILLMHSSLVRSRLRCLDISNNRIGSIGIRIIAHTLAKYPTILDELHVHIDVNILGNSGSNLKFASILLESLLDNTSLKKISLWNQSNVQSAIMGLNILHTQGIDRELITGIQHILEKKVLCDTKSIKSVFRSNHTLMSLEQSEEQLVQAGSVISRMLSINAQNDKSPIQRARDKLRAFYFVGDFSMEPFIDLEIGCLPFAIDLMAKNDGIVTDSRALEQTFRVVSQCIGTITS